MDLSINGKTQSLPKIAVGPQMPLLWVLHDVLGLTGTKLGCGIPACGACTVHVDGKAVRSYITLLATVGAKPVRTIESLRSAA